MEISIDQRLREAARTGNLDALYALIKEDPYMMERVDKIPFVDTPLHIAAHEGHTKFAREMMNLMPPFVRKLNQDGFSPMHLALRNGKTKLVLRLLKTDKDLARVKGREGMTPFHCVATMGNSNLLVEFLEACPECIEDVTVLDETALHLALKNDHIQVFELLIQWLLKNRRRGATDLERKIVNWRDNDDNTLLHIAARKQQRQVLKVLLDLTATLSLDVKAKNSEGLTALQIIQNVERRQDMNSAEDHNINATKIKHLKKAITSCGRIEVMVIRARNNMSGDMLNATLVVTALVITAIYQSSLSPPGGVWQASAADDNPSPSSNVTLHLLVDNNNNNIHFNKSKNIEKLVVVMLGESRKAGTTVMNLDTYLKFWLLNSVTFMIPVLLTILLLSHRLPPFLLVPLYFLVISYFLSMTILSPSSIWSCVNTVVTLIIVFLPVLVFLISFIRILLSPESKEYYNLYGVLHRRNNAGIIQGS